MKHTLPRPMGNLLHPVGAVPDEGRPMTFTSLGVTAELIAQLIIDDDAALHPERFGGV